VRERDCHGVTHSIENIFCREHRTHSLENTFYREHRTSLLTSLFKLNILYTLKILFTQEVDDMMQKLESFIVYIEDIMYIELLHGKITWKILFTQDADDMLEALELSSCVNNIFHVMIILFTQDTDDLLESLELAAPDRAREYVSS